MPIKKSAVTCCVREQSLKQGLRSEDGPLQRCPRVQMELKNTITGVERHRYGLASAIPRPAAMDHQFTASGPNEHAGLPGVNTTR